MLFNSWTRKLLLLQLCFLVVSFTIYSVGIVWKVHFTWRNGIIHNASLSKPDADDIIFTDAEVWGLLICLSSMLYTETQAHPRSESVFGTIYLLISTVSLVLGGETIFKSARDAISLMNQNDNIVSFNHTTLTDPKVILNLTGSLVKGLSWLLFIVQTFTYTHNLADTHTQPSPKHLTTIVHRVQMMVIVSLIYSLVILWMVIASRMDFSFAYDDYFILSYYLVTVLATGCIGDDSAVKGVILSIFSLPFMTVILLDISETIFCNGDCWIQRLNPVQLCIKISSVFAGLFLWMYTFEPFSGEPQLKTGKLYMQAKTTTL